MLQPQGRGDRTGLEPEPQIVDRLRLALGEEEGEGERERGGEGEGRGRGRGGGRSVLQSVLYWWCQGLATNNAACGGVGLHLHHRLRKELHSSAFWVAQTGEHEATCKCVCVCVCVCVGACAYMEHGKENT